MDPPTNLPLAAGTRRARVERRTQETRIELTLDLDGSGQSEASTGVPFLDHMLAQLARHGLFDLTARAQGDIEIDYHHLVEDVGITLGQAFKTAIGGATGLERFGHAVAPLDEALATVALDLSGRGYLETYGSFREGRIRDFELQLLEEFLRGFVMHAGITLHVRIDNGVNPHHKAEAAFKGLAKALRDATRLDPRSPGVPSTKGTL